MPYRCATAAPCAARHERLPANRSARPTQRRVGGGQAGRATGTPPLKPKRPPSTIAHSGYHCKRGGCAGAVAIAYRGTVTWAVRATRCGPAVDLVMSSTKWGHAGDGDQAERGKGGGGTIPRHRELGGWRPFGGPTATGHRRGGTRWEWGAYRQQKTDRGVTRYPHPPLPPLAPPLALTRRRRRRRRRVRQVRCPPPPRGRGGQSRRASPRVPPAARRGPAAAAPGGPPTRGGRRDPVPPPPPPLPRALQLPLTLPPPQERHPTSRRRGRPARRRRRHGRG